MLDKYLRDFYVALAMPGLYALYDKGDRFSDLDEAADEAYNITDALLKARAKNKNVKGVQ